MFHQARPGFFDHLFGRTPSKRVNRKARQGRRLLELETLETRTVPSVALPPHIIDLTVNGDQLANKNDAFTISEDSAGGIQVSVDGQITHYDPSTATKVGTVLRSITVNGLTGNNTLTLDFGKGNFLSLMNPNGNHLPNGLIYFNGGTSPTGTLILKGGHFTRDVDSPTGPHSGSIALDGRLIIYTNIAPMVDTSSAASLTINDPMSDDTINVINDPGSPENGFQTTEINSANNAFEKVDFANKTTVTVNETGSVNVLHLNNPAPAAGLTTLNLNSGSGGDGFFDVVA